MTPAGYRRAALSLPQTREASHMGHPDFRVGARIFATLGYPDAAWGMVKLTPLQQSQLVAAFPRVFVPVRGAWGIRGATHVNLRTATAAALRAGMFAAWRNVAPDEEAPKPAARPRRAAAAGASAARRRGGRR